MHRGLSRLIREHAALTRKQRRAAGAQRDAGTLRVRRLAVRLVPYERRLKGGMVVGAVVFGVCVCASKDHEMGDSHAAGAYPW